MVSAGEQGLDLGSLQPVQMPQGPEDQRPAVLPVHQVSQAHPGAQGGIDPLGNGATVAGASKAVLPPPGLQHTVRRRAAVADEIENLDRGLQPRPWGHGMTRGATIIPRPAMLTSHTSDRNCRTPKA